MFPCLAPSARRGYVSHMRRWIVGASLLIGLLGFGIAFALPSSSVPDCPPPSSIHPCIYETDTRPWIRFLIGAAGLVPAAIVVGTRYQGNRLVATGVVVAGVATAVLLWSIRGDVPTSAGDCVDYPQCYTTEHPDGGPAFVVLFLTLVASIWLWTRTVDVGQGMTHARWRGP
jgi:hypothetical protein